MMSKLNLKKKIVSVLNTQAQKAIKGGKNRTTDPVTMTDHPETTTEQPTTGTNPAPTTEPTTTTVPITFMQGCEPQTLVLTCI